LLPRQIVIDRVVRMKKPWTVGALSLLMVAMVTNHATLGRVLSVVEEKKWSGSETAVSSVDSESKKEMSEDAKHKNVIELFQRVGEQVSAGARRRVMTLELCKAIESSLNRDPTLADKTPVELPYPKREDFHIKRVEQKFEKDLSTWFHTAVAKKYKEQYENRLQLLEIDEDVPPEDPLPPTGQGWIIEITGWHYFNGEENKEYEGEAHVLRKMVEFLEKGSIVPPVKEIIQGGKDQPTEVSLRDLGIRLPVVRKADIDTKHRVPNPEYYKRLTELGLANMASGLGGSGGSGDGMSGPGLSGGIGSGGMPGGPEGGSGYGMQPGMPGRPVLDADGKEIPRDFAAPRCDFIVQFAWRPRFDKDGGALLDGGFPKPTAETAEGDAAATPETTDPAAIGETSVEDPAMVAPQADTPLAADPAVLPPAAPEQTTPETTTPEPAAPAPAGEAPPATPDPAAAKTPS
jgi:type IV pilus assembly protein PilM